MVEPWYSGKLWSNDAHVGLCAVWNDSIKGESWWEFKDKLSFVRQLSSHVQSAQHLHKSSKWRYNSCESYDWYKWWMWRYFSWKIYEVLFLVQVMNGQGRLASHLVNLNESYHSFKWQKYISQRQGPSQLSRTTRSNGGTVLFIICPFLSSLKMLYFAQEHCGQEFRLTLSFVHRFWCAVVFFCSSLSSRRL